MSDDERTLVSAAGNVIATSAAAAHNVSSSAGRAVTRTSAAAQSGAVSIAVTFSDVVALNTAIDVLADHAMSLSGAALSAAADGDLLESVILSPVTGSAAIGALTGTSAALATFSVGSRVLGLSVGAVVTLYSMADATLATSAAALSGAVDVTANVVWGAVNVTAAHGEFIIEAAETTVAAGEVVAAVLPLLAAGAARTSGEFTWNAIAWRADPFNSDKIDRLFNTDYGESFMHHTADSIRFLPNGMLERTLGNLVFVLGQFGVKDEAKLVEQSVVSQEALVERLDDYQRRTVEPGRRTTFEDPSDLTDLFYTMGAIDALGQEDQAVIRVLRKDTEPPAFTVVIPSTQDWSPASGVPNDLTGNLNVMTGDSALLRLADEALANAMRDAGVSDPRSVDVMVSGFSQGGITAGAFAQQFQDKYAIQQVVTIGAPVGQFTGIPQSTNVISYEFADDLVPLLDGRENPDRPGWQTYKMPDGQHQAAAYAQAAEGHGPAADNNLGRFLSSGDDLVHTDYYGVRK